MSKYRVLQQPLGISKESESTIKDLFRPLPICIRTLNMFYNWIVTTLCYYGLTMTASSLSDDVFLNFILLIVVEIPAHFFCIMVMDKWGRKLILGFCQVMSGAACIVAGFVGHIPWLQVSYLNLKLIVNIDFSCNF